jgi:peroxiredoxin
LAISPSRPEFARQIVKKNNLTIPVLCDQNNIIADKFRVVFTVPDELREVYLSFGIDLERHNGDQSWTLPMPARYLIGKDGTILDSDIRFDHTTRPEPKDLLKKLEEINP